MGAQSTFTEIDRLFQWTVTDHMLRYDVPRQLQTRKRRGQLHCSYPQLILNETLWGINILGGVATISGHCISSAWQLD